MCEVIIGLDSISTIHPHGIGALDMVIRTTLGWALAIHIARTAMAILTMAVTAGPRTTVDTATMEDIIRTTLTMDIPS